MHVIEVGPISNNPQTLYTLVFGRNVSSEKIMDSLKQTAAMREKLGLTTEENTIQIIKEAEEKLKTIFV